MKTRTAINPGVYNCNVAPCFLFCPLYPSIVDSCALHIVFGLRMLQPCAGWENIIRRHSFYLLLSFLTQSQKFPAMPTRNSQRPSAAWENFLGSSVTLVDYQSFLFNANKKRKIMISFPLPPPFFYHLICQIK